MVKVPPGDQTGLYYIVVSNLPWSCTWQKLKDFSRNHPDGTYLNVDHAYVYPGSGPMCSGDGWVRIVGKPDFKKAFKHLNGGIMENRALVADDRNETQPLHIRDIVPTKQPLSRGRHDSIARSDYLFSPSASVYQHSQHSETSPPISNSSGPESYETWNYGQQNVANNASSSPAFLTNTPYYQPPPQTYETPQGTFQVSHNQEYFAIPTTTVVYVGSIAPVYPRIPATTYMSVPPSMLTPLPHLDTMSSTNKCMSQGTVQPEARKIIITKLSHDIKDSELGTLVRRACSKYRPRTQSEQDHPIHSVDLPRYPGGKPKGHAFVIFDSQALAEHTVSSLDGSKFQGRSLGAKLAKEGVEPVGGYGNIEGLSQYPMGPPQCIEEMNNGSGNSNPQKPSGKIEKARTLVVHGDGKGKKSEKKDSAKGKESSPETKSKEKDKENRQPLVVDGSGRHRR